MTILLSYELPDLNDEKERGFECGVLSPIERLLNYNLADSFGDLQKKGSYDPLSIGRLDPKSGLYVPLIWKTNNDDRYQSEFRHFSSLGIPGLILLKKGVRLPSNYVPTKIRDEEVPLSKIVIFDTISELEEKILKLQGREDFFRKLETQKENFSLS